MADLGGSNLAFGPERYVGRYTNATLDFAGWTSLTSASFRDVLTVATVGSVLPADLQFLTLLFTNLGPTSVYLMLTGVGPLVPTGDAIYVPPSGSGAPNSISLHLGAILPNVSTPSGPIINTPTGVRTISIRGDSDNSAAGDCIIQASFSGAYGP